MAIKEILTLRWRKYRFYKNMCLFYLACIVASGVQSNPVAVTTAVLGLFSMLWIWHLEVKQKRAVHKMWADVLHGLAEKHNIAEIPPPETGEYATGVHSDLCDDLPHDA